MSQIKKRFQGILNNPTDIKWDELIPVLKHYGFIIKKPTNGSHWIVYHSKSEDNTSIPVKNNRIKAVYVKKLIKLIESITEED